MNILVIDDSSLHQQSARQTIKGHNLTIVGSYDEAFVLLEEPTDQIRTTARMELDAEGFQFADNDASHEEKIAFLRVLGRRWREVIIPTPAFDVVLTDLLMPASKRAMAGSGLKFVGQEMSVGFALVMMAAQCGVKFAAVLTDTDHHHHPASAWLDPFASRCPDKHSTFGHPPRFKINNTVVGFYHSPLCPVDGTNCPVCMRSGRENWRQRCPSEGNAKGKDWGAVLSHLLEN